MRCKFCAEEIQDEAVVCRFCGAVEEDGEWRLSPYVVRSRSKPSPPGQFTLRSAAVMFVLSAAFELWSVTDEVPLFGSLHGGVVAAAYHLVYVALFAALGFGLWLGSRWGYRMVFAGTAFYTVDRLLVAFDHAALEAQLAKQIADYRELLQYIDEEEMIRVASLTVMLFVACWWGFAVYVYLRRSYFGVRV